MAEILDLMDWRGRAMRAERAWLKERQSAENLRALKATNEKLIDDMVALIKSFTEVEEVYYGGGQYALAPRMTRYEIEQACHQFLADRVL